MDNRHDAMAYQLAQYQNQLAQQMQYKTGLDLGYLFGAVGGQVVRNPMPVGPKINDLLLLVEEECE